MGLFTGGPIRQSRLLRVLGLTIVALTAACSDTTKGPSGLHENTPSPASLKLVARFPALPEGGPTIFVGTVTGTLTNMEGVKSTAAGQLTRDGGSTLPGGSNGASHSISGTGQVSGELATVDFNVEVFGASDAFTLEVSAFDADGVVAFTASLPLNLRAGANTANAVFVYAGPDKAVSLLDVSPGTLSLDPFATQALTAIGKDGSGQAITPLRVGWTSRDPLLATVDANGVVRANERLGATYIVGRLANNTADSVLVQVHGPIDKLVVSPGAALIIRGQTATLLAQQFDAVGTLITGDPVTWSSSDQAVAIVSPTGVVTGVMLGTATVTADVKGKTATAAITVVSPLDHIELTPPALSFASLGDKQTLIAKLVPKPGASVSGIVVTFTSSDPKVATVDENGVVTAVGAGSATITASADGATTTATVTVKQTAASLVIAPKAAGLAALGDKATFTVKLLDQGGAVIANPSCTWTSSDVTVATVAGGVATAKKNGTTTITATCDGLSDSATLVVSQLVKMLVVTTDKTSIAVGGTAQAKAYYADANGYPMGDAVVAEWTTTTPSIISVSSTGLVGGLSGGTGNVVATAGAFSGSASIKVTGGGGSGGLVISPSTVEKLPRGFQHFVVLSGSEGPFTWWVNGIEHGDDTFGLISWEGSQGYYTAPDAVPTPATFQVCAREEEGTKFGCATVTISPIPTGGADLVVFNDVNPFQDPGEGDPNNLQLYRNLVSFTGPGPRATQTGVMFYNGHNSRHPMTTVGTIIGNTIRDAGYTTADVSSNFAEPIPSNYKVIFLWLPMVDFSTTEINHLKQFAAEGGRLIFIGEWDGYYGSGISLENRFFQVMGAQMTNTGGAYDCSYHVEEFDKLRPHQITTGLNQITIACASEVLPGPNDYPFMYDHSGARVLAAVAKIDVTPIIEGENAMQSRRTIKAAPPKARLSIPSPTLNLDPNDPAGRPKKP